MFFFLLPLFAVLVGLGVWKILANTSLHRMARVLIAIFIGIAAAILLYHAMLYLSILLFLANEPTTW